MLFFQNYAHFLTFYPPSSTPQPSVGTCMLLFSNCGEMSFLFVLEFNASFTAKVISLQSVVHLCVSWLSDTNTESTFLSTFLTHIRGERRKITAKKVLPSQVSYPRKPAFGIPWVMGAIISLSCNWWKNMHQIDA